MENEKEHGAHTLRVQAGTVVGRAGQDVFIELGPRSQGVIALGEFDEPPSEGDVFEFTLRGQEEDLWVLALAEKKHLASWEDLERGSLVAARVIKSVPGGLQLKIGPLHAFMPRSQTGLARDKQPAILIGKTLTCEVIEVDAARQRVLVSRKLVLKRERESPAGRRIGELAPGQVVQGRVTRIEDFGVFLRFGRGVEGLIHVSNLALERVSHPSELVKLGDTLEARVLYIKNQGKRIGLGLKQMRESPWKRLESVHFVGQIVDGRVTRIESYGAFVALRPGVEGLLHRSECGRDDQAVAAFLAPGQALSLRITDLDCEGERLSLSLLHKNGARIAPGEAESARIFAELQSEAAEVEAAPGSISLGPLLRRALGPSPEADAGATHPQDDPPAAEAG